jgi:hypothetical protein
MKDLNQNKPKPSALPGLAAIGLIITGIAGIHLAYDTSSPLGLIASALSFGCIVVVMF